MITTVPTVVEFVALYAAQQPIAENTVYQYSQTAKALERWAERPVPCSYLSDELINCWLSAMAGNCLAPATASSRRKHMLALWRSAHKNGLVDKLPKNIRRVKVPFHVPVAWTRDQVRKIFDEAVWIRGYFPTNGVERSKYWRALIATEWDTALRTNDLLSILPTDLNETAGTIVQKKTGFMLSFRLHESTHRLLEGIYRSAEEPLLDWGASGEGFRQQFRRLVRNAGVPYGSFKRLRKSSASNVEMHHPGCGAAHLGHANDMASNHYLDPRITGTKKPMPEELVSIDEA